MTKMIISKPSPPYVVVLSHPRRTRKNGAMYGLVSSVAAKSPYSETHLRTLLREGKVEGMKVGSLWLANRTAVREYEERQAKTPK